MIGNKGKEQDQPPKSCAARLDQNGRLDCAEDQEQHKHSLGNERRTATAAKKHSGKDQEQEKAYDARLKKQIDIRVMRLYQHGHVENQEGVVTLRMVVAIPLIGEQIAKTRAKQALRLLQTLKHLESVDNGGPSAALIQIAHSGE